MSVIRICRSSLLNSTSKIKFPVRDYNVDTKVKKAKATEEYTSVAQYPEILDLSRKAKKARAHLEEAENLRKVETVEEKLIKINMPKYYGWNCMMMGGNETPLGALPFVQHVTRTHLIKSASLPDYYLSYDTAASFMAKQIRSQIEDDVKYEYQDVRRQFDFSNDLKTPHNVQEEKIKSKIIIESINRIITNHLAPSVPHIFDIQLDIEPRHESFWFSGGFPRYHTLEKIEKGKELFFMDKAIQYIGNPVLTLRSTLPLEPLVPYSDASNDSLHVPQYEFDARAAGYFKNYRHGTNIPGFWPGDSHEFGILSFHTREQLLKALSSFPADYIDKSLDVQGILNSFGWLMSQATYQGFSTYNDVTYPLVTQTVVSNGQYWSLFAYQMNTVFTHHEHYKTNKLRNICYSVGPLKLFDGIDNDGKLIGFNDDILKMLIQFYINIPAERPGVEMKPYLSGKAQIVADIEDDERRNWLQKCYKHLMANRPRHLLPEEIYDWERIYKIQFQSRWGDNTRKSFEYPGVQSPHKRRLDDHVSVYIPKALRKEGFKSVVKWEKTYYP